MRSDIFECAAHFIIYQNNYCNCKEITALNTALGLYMYEFAILNQMLTRTERKSLKEIVVGRTIIKC